MDLADQANLVRPETRIQEDPAVQPEAIQVRKKWSHRNIVHCLPGNDIRFAS